MRTTLIAVMGVCMALAIGALLNNIHESARYHSAGLNPIGNSISIPGRH